MLLKTLLFLSLFSCSTYENYKNFSKEFDIPTQVYREDFPETWAAVIASIKKYDLEEQNQETGVIKTRWIDNTLELNFSDSFNPSDQIRTARFKLFINVEKPTSSSNRTKVTILKRQIVEKDLLNGWKEIKNDHTLEYTLLYRIRRVIAIDNQLEKLQRAKEEKLIQDF